MFTKLPSLVSVCSLVLSAALPAFSQKIDHYTMDVEMLPDEGILRVEVVVSLAAPEAGLGALSFCINNTLVFTSFQIDGKDEEYLIKDAEKGSCRYSPAAVPVEVQLDKPLEAGKRMNLQLSYHGPIEMDQWTTNRLTREWIELGLYSAWFPRFMEAWGFTYDIDLKIDPSYMVTGTGEHTFENGRWRIVENDPTGDIVLLSSPSMKRSVVGDNETKVAIYHTGLNESQVDQIASDANRILREFETWFGATSHSDLTIAFAPRESGGGYARTGLIVMTYEPEKTSYAWLIKGLAHEFAHFWWHGADTNSWEDWVNESFAEYASLMFVRSLYGAEAFQKDIDAYKAQVVNRPPIKGIDRGSEHAYFVLYYKGALLLHELEQRIGSEAFITFLQTLVREKVHATEPLLSCLEKSTSPEIRVWFEEGLSR